MGKINTAKTKDKPRYVKKPDTQNGKGKYTSPHPPKHTFLFKDIIKTYIY